MKSSVTRPAAAVEQCQVKSRKDFFSNCVCFSECPNLIKSFRDIHQGTVNHVTGKNPLERPIGGFPASAGAFHLERPLKFEFNAY